MKLNLIFCILPSSEDMIEKLHTNENVGITDLLFKAIFLDALEKLHLTENTHCVKSVRIWSYSGPFFPAFELNTETYKVSYRF